MENQTINTQGLIIAALQSHFKAQRDEAVAGLSIYINNAVGVADHSAIIKECASLVRQISDAEEQLRTLQSLFVRKD